MDDSDSTFTVELDTFAAESRTFVHACIKVGASVIGDMDQTVLLGSFRLGISDTVRRLSKGIDIVFSDGVDFQTAFEALYDAAWNGETRTISSLLGWNCTSEEAMLHVAIPVGIETFDGEQGFSFAIGKNQCFCWRDWDSKQIRMAHLEKSSLISAYSTALSQLDFS